MRIDVLMPKMGESITEGKILSWAKAKGDRVDRDETILEISTDKVDTEVPAPEAGIIVEIFAQEGETVEVGAKIAVIDTDSNAVVDSDAAPANQTSDPEPEVVPIAPQTSEPVPLPVVPQVAEPVREAASKTEGKRFYSPVVMRMASEEALGMDELERIPGTGTGGRVTKKDIQDYVVNRELTPKTAAGQAAATTAPNAVASTNATEATNAKQAPAIPVTAKDGIEVVPMDNIKRLMAEHMVKSVQISPHVTLVAEVDMTKIVKFREQFTEDFKKREGISLTFMPFIAEASVRALKDFPYVNASIDGQNILVKKNIGLGIAVSMNDGGLIVPVVKGADMMNRSGLARSINDLAKRARTRRLQPEEIQDGTFTITNFGVFGSLFGTPIINQPQVAILGVGAITKRPVVIERDGEDVIAIRSMMLLSLTFDHRLIDGALGGQYLERAKRYLEDFSDTSI